MRSYGLPIGEGAEFGIGFSAGLFEVCHKPAVKLPATVHDGMIPCMGFLKSLKDSHLSVLFPVGHPVVLKILDRIDIVVSDHDKALRTGRYLSQILTKGHHGQGLFFSGRYSGAGRGDDRSLFGELPFDGLAFPCMDVGTIIISGG
jgi:hypothetical protein